MTNHLREVVADALLPCPVCIGKGSVDRQHDADGMLWVYVSCNKCGLRTRGKWCSSGNDCPLFYREVRDEWNTRATLPTQSAGVEEQSGKSMYDEYSGNHPTIHCNRFPSWSELTHDQRDEWNRKAATLGRQQGGEQEATCAGCNGRGEVGGWAGDGYQTDPCPFCTPSGLPDALTGDFDCPKAAECRACPCGFCTALRSKQPAASEGDVARDAVLAGYARELGFGDLDEHLAPLLLEHMLRAIGVQRKIEALTNTSKQAAGEAVAWQIMRAAFVTADENYSGKRVAAVYADASMIGQRVRLIFDTTPPRHPADEALIAAYDAGFAASDEGWNAEIWPDVESRPDYYVKDRAEAIAALQAGTP